MLFSIPILLAFVTLELCLRSIPNDYSFKNKYLEQNSAQIEHLFLGSSHAYYSINPEYISEHAFNASHISQSLDYDYAIFDKFKDDFRALKTIVLPIDYFSMFSRTATGIEAWRVKNYEIYYGINRSYDPKDHSELLNFKFSTSLKRVFAYLEDTDKGSITCSKLGFGNTVRQQKDLLESGQLAAKRHTKDDISYYQKNLAILRQFVAEAKQRNIQIVLYTSPAYPSYWENLDNNQLSITLDAVKELSTQNENCSYYNFLYDSDFNATDFRDADHLNIQGAQKFSRKLDSILIRDY